MHRIDQTITDTRPVPLTNQVRIEKRPVLDALDGMRAELDAQVQAGGRPSDDLLVAIDSFDNLIHNARPVPLTDWIRLDSEELDATAGTLRDAIARGNRPSPTN